MQTPLVRHKGRLRHLKSFLKDADKFQKKKYNRLARENNQKNVRVAWVSQPHALITDNLLQCGPDPQIKKLLQQLKKDAKQYLQPLHVATTGLKHNPTPPHPVIITLPHACPQYSGMLAHLAILSSFTDTSVPVYLLGFNHRAQSPKQDHSYVHPMECLINCGFETRQILDLDHLPLSKIQYMVVSTDMSHFNAPSETSTKGLHTKQSISLQDVCYFHDLRVPASSLNEAPCGLHQVQETQTKFRLKRFGSRLYHNSDYGTIFDPSMDYPTAKFWNLPPLGVGYLYAVAEFHDGCSSEVSAWAQTLTNRGLAAAHAHWLVKRLFQRSAGPPDEATLSPLAIWSPLHHIGGSVFVTVHDGKGDTYSCWGSWSKGPHTARDNLFTNMTRASDFVIHNKWGDNPALKDRKDVDVSSVEVTLIPPKRWWTLQPTNTCVKGLGCFVVTHVSSATYLPGVWAQFRTKTDFLQALIRKAGGTALSDAVRVWTYPCVTWNFQVNNTGASQP